MHYAAAPKAGHRASDIAVPHGWSCRHCPRPRAALPHALIEKGVAMRDMMDGMGGMMAGMGLLWLLAIVVLVLAAAALVKYLFFSRDR